MQADKEFIDGVRPKSPPPMPQEEVTKFIKLVKEQGRDFNKISEKVKRSFGSCY